METVQESDSEEQVRGGKTWEEEDDDGEPTQLEETLRHASAPRERLSEKLVFVPTNYKSVLLLGYIRAWVWYLLTKMIHSRTKNK